MSVAIGSVLARSLQQRMDALEHANEVRVARAALKREVRGRRVSVRSVLLDPPDYALTMRVSELLLCAPKVGRVKVNKWLARACMSPSKTLGGMTARQRSELAALLPSSYIMI